MNQENNGLLHLFLSLCLYILILHYEKPMLYSYMFLNNYVKQFYQ